MKKYKKAILGSLSIVGTLSSPIVFVVSCGDWKGDFQLRLNGETNEELSKKLALVTDGGSVDDKSFNEQSYIAYKKLSGRSKESALRPDSGTTFEIKKRYETAAKSGARVIIAPGFHHMSAIESFNKSFGEKKVGFLLVDAEIKKANGKPPSNVASMMFKTKYSGFLAGYLASQYLIEVKHDKTPKVGTFGGANFPGVTDFMVGFVAGVKWYNDSKNPQHKVEFAKYARDEEYTNSGFAAGKGTSYAEKLLNEGADVILPVAGPQTGDVISAINQNQNHSDVKIVGVDTDQSKQYIADSNKFLTSIIKNLALAIEKVWKKSIDPSGHTNTAYKGINGFGQTTYGTLENDLTGIAAPNVSNVESIYQAIVNNDKLKQKAKDMTDDWSWSSKGSKIQAIDILKNM